MQNNKKVFFEYFFAMLLTGIILFWLFQLWNFNIYIPMSYTWDALGTGSFIKGIIDNGWLLENKHLGAPFTQETYDFLQTDLFHFAFVKLLAVFIHDYAVILNVIYLLSFFLATLTALYTLRSFKVSFLPSLFSSILFSFMSYHFLRFNIGHVFLSIYYIIPLVFLLLVRVYEDERYIFFNIEKKSRFSFFNKKSIISIILCLIIASSGTYYAFFTCALLGVITLSHLFSKNYKKVLDIIILISIVVIGFFVNLFPAIVYHFHHGNNLVTAVRNPIEAEYYGLKITQFFIPITGFSIGIIRDLIHNYSSSPLNNEGSEYLGIFGSIGFLYLVLNLIILRKRNENNLLNKLSILNIAMILLGTIGGFGSIFALLISAQIRAYNRISIFIAFVALTALSILIDKFLGKISGYLKIIAFACLGIMLIVGIIDQSGNRKLAPDTKVITSEYNNDQDFISRIESSVPIGSKIFQLPYVPFPENPPVNKMNDYELLKGYLHSKKLNWSYGAMKGRREDEWLNTVSKQSTIEMLETISFSGFNGIYIDRFGYEDQADSLTKELKIILKTDPLISKNGRLLFFNLNTFNANLFKGYSENELEKKKEEVLYPIEVSWGGGFYDLEMNEVQNWRWSSQQGEIIINNPSPYMKKISLEMTFESGYETDSNLYFSGDLIKDSIIINHKGEEYRKVIEVQPGRHRITLRSNATRVEAAGDDRYLSFRILNFNMNDLD